MITGATTSLRELARTHPTAARVFLRRLARIRELTGELRPPAVACTLEAPAAELMQHLHLENHDA